MRMENYGSLQHLERSIRIEKKDILMLEAPLSVHGTYVRLEREEAHIAQWAVITRLDIDTIFTARGDAVAQVPAEVQV